MRREMFKLSKLTNLWMPGVCLAWFGAVEVSICQMIVVLPGQSEAGVESFGKRLIHASVKPISSNST